MDTQNTPIHPRLWHRDFWLLVFANMMLTMSVYMLVPVLPIWLSGGSVQMDKMSVGAVMGAYGLGLFVLGPFCNYWVQKYRRHHVCMLAVLGMMLILALLFVCIEKQAYWKLGAGCYVGLRFMLGAAFGIAQMVLSSTLVIDTSESFQRTEACYSAAWFARFSLSLGPMLALVLCRYFSRGAVCFVVMGVAAVSLLLLRAVSFPFKAPDDTMTKIGLDRFFLPQGGLLFLNLLLITTVMGLLMTLPLSAQFYTMLMGGFLLALLAEKYAFPDADLKSEAVTGLLAVGAAVLLLLLRGTQPTVAYIAPMLIGMGMGLVGSRFLLFFIKLSQHCQRGTSQSTFFLVWEAGISLGLFVGYALSGSVASTLLYYCLPLIIVNLVFYNFVVHPWYMSHKNR